jgi:glycosyltransferase involved in cell wall biosynthesis
VARFFQSADVVLLTYDAGFVSQSAVLHLAANWDKPVVASSGPGPLVDTVARYRLGIIVEPGSETDLVGALEKILSRDHPQMEWDRFRDAASWSTNVDRLLEALEQLQISATETARSACGGRKQSGITS